MEILPGNNQWLAGKKNGSIRIENINQTRTSSAGSNARKTAGLLKNDGASEKPLMKVNGETKAGHSPFHISNGNPGCYDSWSSSTDNSPSSRSYTISTTSGGSIENGNSPRAAALPKDLPPIEVKKRPLNEALSLSNGNGDCGSGETNADCAEKDDLKAALVSAEGINDSIVHCANISDYVESALLSSSSNLNSTNKLNSDAKSLSPRLSSFQSSSTLNQDTNSLISDPEPVTSFGDFKADFVTLDYIKSAAAKERKKTSDSCSSSLSSSLMSSIGSEDGSSIGSDVVESLCSKIAAATAKRKMKTASQEHIPVQLATDSAILTSDSPKPDKCTGATVLIAGQENNQNKELESPAGPCDGDNDDEVTDLDYSNCNLKDIPPDLLQHASTLQRLSLESNAIVDLSKDLFECSNLRELIIGDNDIATLPPSLAGLTELRHLDVSKNVIEDIPECMPCLKNLAVLDASVNPIEKLSEGFTRLMNLQELYMNDCFFDYLPASFGRMTELRVLELRDNQLQILPKSIRRLLNLTRLDLGGNALQDWPGVISKLTGLRELWLDCNELSSLSTEVGQLTQLTYLDLSRNLLESIPNQIGSLHHVTDLLLSENNIARLPESIGFLQHLTVMNIEHNQIEQLPDSIGKLESLQEFDASHNKLKALPPTVGNLKKLSMLLLDDNELDAIPCELGQCEAMSVLQLSGNRIEAVPASFGDLKNLRVLNISQNRISHLPTSLRNLTRLEALWISPNQSKPSVPVHVERDPLTDSQVLTNMLFPQEENGSSRVSKVLGSDQDDDGFAIDAADDDDLDAYSSRARGKTRVVFNLNATTYSDAVDTQWNDYDINDHSSASVGGQLDSRNVFVDVGDEERYGGLSETARDEEKGAKNLQSSTDQFAIEIPRVREPTGLVVSIATEKQEEEVDRKLDVARDTPTTPEVGGLGLNRSTKDVDLYPPASDFPTPPSSPMLIESKSLDVFVEPISEALAPPSDLPLVRGENSPIVDLKAPDNVSNHANRGVEPGPDEKLKPKVPEKPSKLRGREGHASSETAPNEPATDKTTSFEAEAELLVDASAKNNLVNEVKSNESERFGDRSLRSVEDQEIKAKPSVASVKSLAEELNFIDEDLSENSLISTPYQAPHSYKPADKLSFGESIPPTDDSRLGLNGLDPNERTDDMKDTSIVASNARKAHFKVSWKKSNESTPPGSSAEKKIDESKNEVSQSEIKVIQNKKQSSEKSGFQSVGESQISRPRKSAPPPPPPKKKSSVSDNIRKFQKHLDSGIPSSANTTSSNSDFSKQRPQISSKKPATLSTTKPMAVATIVSSSIREPEPSIEVKISNDLFKPDVPSVTDDMTMVNDVLKSLDLYTKTRDGQRRKPSVENRFDAVDSSLKEQSSKAEPGEESGSMRRQNAHARKSKFDEALAATKHKHFREKLEKAMQLQQSSVGETARRLSRGSNSSISSIPRITSPVPHHHGVILDPGSAKNRPSIGKNSMTMQSTASLFGSKTSTPNSSSQQAASSKPIRRGASQRSSSRTQMPSRAENNDSVQEAPKISLEEQLGQLLIDGSSSPPHDRGFVPYLSDEYYQSTSTRSIKKSKDTSAKEARTFSDAPSEPTRRPSRPEDWKHQLLDYLERKKGESEKSVKKEAMKLSSPHAQHQPTALPSPIVKSPAPPPVKQQAKQNYTRPHSSAAKPNLSVQRELKKPLSSKLDDKTPTEKLSRPEIPSSNFVRSTSSANTKHSTRRSSGKYQRTRTPAPESTEPKITDSVVRPKSALDRPIHSEFFDPFPADFGGKKSQQQQQQLNPRPSKPPPIAAPPSYNDHILRHANSSTQNDSHANYVNLEFFHNRQRANAREKEQRPEAPIHHVPSSANQIRDLPSKPMQQRDLFQHKQDALFLSPNPHHNPMASSGNPHHPALQGVDSRKDRRFLMQEKKQPYVADVSEQLYDDLANGGRGAFYQRDPYSRVETHAPSRPAKPLYHGQQAFETAEKRLDSRYAIYEDPYHTQHPQPHRGYYSSHHHPHSEYTNHFNSVPFHYPDPQPHHGYAEEDESAVSAFRPYNHEAPGLNQRPHLGKAAYGGDHRPLPVQYDKSSPLYGQHPVYFDQRRQQIPTDAGGFVDLDSAYPHYVDDRMRYETEDYYRVANVNQPGRSMNKSAPEDFHNPIHDSAGYGVELVKVTVRKNPNFGFHIMGGVDAGGNPYRPDDEGVFITYVAPGGAADGLVQPGDKLLLVNGSDFVAISHKRAVQLLKNAGNSAFLVLERLVGKPV